MRIPILVFLVLACGCSGKTLIEKPRLDVRKVKIENLTPEGATFVIALNVFNPNAFALKVDALKYDIELDGRKLAAGEITDLAKVGAKSEGLVEVPIPVKFQDLFSSALEFALKGKSLYRIKGEARFDFLKIPFDDSGELKLK